MSKNKAKKREPNAGSFVIGDERCHRAATPASFRAGYDPRRLAKQPGIVQMMRDRLPDCIDIIDHILKSPLNDKSISMSLRMRAVELVIERGYGKPQSSEILALKELTPSEARKLSLDELAQLVDAA